MIEHAVENSVEKDKDFALISNLLFLLQSYKAKRYGSSWCKHGEAISVFGNLSRKYDRIEHIITQHIKERTPLPAPESEESLAETVADLAVYAILWLLYIQENRPVEMDAWSSRITKMIGTELSREIDYLKDLNNQSVYALREVVNPKFSKMSCTQDLDEVEF